MFMEKIMKSIKRAMKWFHVKKNVNYVPDWIKMVKINSPMFGCQASTKVTLPKVLTSHLWLLDDWRTDATKYKL